MIRVGVLGLASLVVVAGASAQQAPPGWQVVRTERTWAATSPPQPNGDRVRLVFYRAVTASGELEAWFEEEIARRTAAAGAGVLRGPVIGRQASSPVAPLLRRVVALSRVGQARSTIVANFGYETREGRQFVQIVMPAWPGKPRGDYLAAVEHVAAAWGAGVVYRQGAAATSAPGP